MAAYRSKIAGFLFFVLLILVGASLSAQPFSRARTSTFGQEVPPFLREAPAKRTAVIGGKERIIPRFSVGFNPRVVSPLMLPVKANPTFLEDYAAANGINQYLTYPYLENFADTPNNLPVLSGLRGPSARFDYQQAAPHLAFFCRLEINEKAGNVIPAKFRLGGVRHWQDNLRRQD